MPSTVFLWTSEAGLDISGYFETKYMVVVVPSLRCFSDLKAFVFSAFNIVFCGVFFMLS